MAGLGAAVAATGLGLTDQVDDDGRCDVVGFEMPPESDVGILTRGGGVAARTLTHFDAAGGRQ